MKHERLWHLCLLLGVVLMAGCAKKSTGTAGAASIDELVERYKQAHRAKDIEALRSIHFLHNVPVMYIHTRHGGIGAGETVFPLLFEFELKDVEVIELPMKDGAAELQYAIERNATRENGFHPIRLDSALNNQGYKLILLGRRPSEPQGPLMEVDASIGVGVFEGRYYLLESTVAEPVADWVNGGPRPWIFRPPDHKPIQFHETPKKVPAGWVGVVRRQDGK